MRLWDSSPKFTDSAFFTVNTTGDTEQSSYTFFNCSGCPDFLTVSKSVRSASSRCCSFGLVSFFTWFSPGLCCKYFWYFLFGYFWTKPEIRWMFFCSLRLAVQDQWFPSDCNFKQFCSCQFRVEVLSISSLSVIKVSIFICCLGIQRLLVFHRGIILHICFHLGSIFFVIRFVSTFVYLVDYCY